MRPFHQLNLPRWRLVTKIAIGTVSALHLLDAIAGVIDTKYVPLSYSAYFYLMDLFSEADTGRFSKRFMLLSIQIAERENKLFRINFFYQPCPVVKINSPA